MMLHNARRQENDWAAHHTSAASGFTADLTVMRRDPGRHIHALAAVEYTLRDGTIIYRRR